MEKINRPNRKSVRLKDYDYSQPGEYFITICTHNHECTLGEIINGEMHLNEIGKIIEEEWLRTEIIRPDVQLDEYVILLHALRVAVIGLRLPNHVHGIIILNEGRGTFKSDIPVGANCHSPSNTIGAIVRGLKSTTTKRINEIRGTPGIQFWQRNYYEHIIRNDRELDIIRDYIFNNIVNWALEKDNPDNIPLW
jgi:putative transposase